MNVTLTVNGEAHSVDVAPNTLLVELLRNHLGLRARTSVAIPANAARAPYT